MTDQQAQPQPQAQENFFLTQQRIMLESNAQALDKGFGELTSQLTGLTSAVYTQSVSQVVTPFDGDPSKFKNYVKAVEKYATLTRLVDRDIPMIAYQTSLGPAGDYIKRYLDEKDENNQHASWDELLPRLTARFAEISDKHVAFAALRQIKQKPTETVQIFSERLLSLAEDAYPQPQDRAVVEHQLINIFIDGISQPYVKMRILRDDPRTFEQAVESAIREVNIRKRFSFREESNTRPQREVQNFQNRNGQVTPMEVDHSRPKRCYKCKRTGHFSKDCRSRRVYAVNESPRNQNFNFASYECWHCKQMGHIRRFCPQLHSPANSGRQGN